MSKGGSPLRCAALAALLLAACVASAATVSTAGAGDALAASSQGLSGARQRRLAAVETIEGDDEEFEGDGAEAVVADDQEEAEEEAAAEEAADEADAAADVSSLKGDAKTAAALFAEEADEEVAAAEDGPAPALARKAAAEAAAAAAGGPGKRGDVAAAVNPTGITPMIGKGKRAKKPAFMNKVVEFAPAVNVTFGDDIDDEGACAVEIEKLCKDEEEGESSLADCISDYIAESEDPDAAEPDAVVVSDACRTEVYNFKIQRNSNINHNVPLAKACKFDANKFCNVTWFFGYKAGQIISCLRDVKGQVSKPCNAQLFKVMLAAAVDFRVDPMLYESCKEDADSLCPTVKNGGGRIQACLRDKRMQLSWSCEEQLFRQEMENADDIRLSVRLFSRCMPDKKRFCKDVAPGNARAKDCLEEHRAELTLGCKEEMDGMIERRVRDFRLDSRLRTACENEIFNMCAYFGDLDDIDTYDSSVINCLQDYQAEIKTGECKRQVKKYVELASSDIRFDVPLAEACYDDRQKFCANIPPGSARVIRCLTSQRDSLSPVCRATLFDEEVRFSENIDFQTPMKEACGSEITRFCANVPAGNAKVIRCLQEKKGDKSFGKACREEVQRFEGEISKDYRLNSRLSAACEADISSLCSGLCAISDGAICGGKVLRCLTDKVEDLKADECKREVKYFEKMEVSDFRNDILLAQSCREDVDKFCANIEAGEGRMHACLRDNRKKLSPACRSEELLLEEKEAESIELTLSLMKTCKAERQLFCQDVAPGQARVFRCLAENMNDADFSNQCKYQIIYKLQRRQANWKLDPPLRKACRADVAQRCTNEDIANTEDSRVYKCLIATVNEISPGCQKELGRAVHMAFYVWQPALALTSDCDEDIQALCLSERPNMANRPGAIGTCLATILEKHDRSSSQRRSLLAEGDGKAPRPTTGGGAMAPSGKLSDKCFVLADIAEPPNMKVAFESSLSFALLQSQLERVEVGTGLPLVSRDRRTGDARGISLTGWMATLGMTSLVVLILYGAFTAYKRVRGISDQDYTLVVKAGAR